MFVYISALFYFCISSPVVRGATSKFMKIEPSQSAISDLCHCTNFSKKQAVLHSSQAIQLRESVVLIPKFQLSNSQHKVVFLSPQQQ